MADTCTAEECDRQQARHRTLCAEHDRIRALEEMQACLWQRLDGMQQALRVAALSAEIEVRSVAREALISHGRWAMDDNLLNDGWEWRA